MITYRNSVKSGAYESGICKKVKLLLMLIYTEFVLKIFFNSLISEGMGKM